ncbi:unnamed protein product [Lactuca virosa]|uniref:Uncharacterized protein n=1 Tax=Lactuca virosa TaxID=75947 RepID=A0AAU9NTL2_9ASTR|nr:unnamed protein product [Lactuca virosa]
MKVRSNSPLRQKCPSNHHFEICKLQRTGSGKECVDLRWCRSETKKVFKKRNSHEDEGDDNKDDDGVDLMNRSRSSARRQSRQCDSSKEGEAFVNNEAFDGGGEGDSSGETLSHDAYSKIQIPFAVLTSRQPYKTLLPTTISIFRFQVFSFPHFLLQHHFFVFLLLVGCW